MGEAFGFASRKAAAFLAIALRAIDGAARRQLKALALFKNLCYNNVAKVKGGNIMWEAMQTKFSKWIATVFTFIYVSLFVLPFGMDMPKERKCAPEFNGTFLQSWLSSSWDEEDWAKEIAAMEKDGVKYLIIQDLATMDLEGNWTIYYDSDLSVFENADVGTDVLANTFEALKGSDIQVFVGLTTFDNLWSTGTLTKEYRDVCDVTADMMQEIYDKYYVGNEDNFYSWYFTMEFSNNILMQLGTANIVKGLNVVLDKATAIDESIPLMMSPFMSNYYTVGKAAALLQWIKLFSDVHWRDGDIVAPQDAVGARWLDVEDLIDMWEIYSRAIAFSDADVKLWANCENFTSAVADSFGAGILNPKPTENVVHVPSTLDRFTYQMDVASRYCENIITFSYTHYYSENQVSGVFIETYKDYVENGYKLETKAPVMGGCTKTQSDDGIDLQWDEATDNIGISHYRIMKNGKFLCRAETFDGYHRLSCTDENGSMSDIYTIVAVDAAGNISQEVEAK